MKALADRLKELALEHGADLVGVAHKDRLADAPPSGDPTYLLPSARSMISLAVAIDPKVSGDFIAKRSWEPYCNSRKPMMQKLYTVGDKLVGLLRAEGFEALVVDLNDNYRPEEGAADYTEMSEFYPDFAHRYAAIAAGLGRQGWSGHLMTPRFGSLIELGTVLTSAELPSDPVMEKSPCDGCKACSFVCPAGMISPKDSRKVTIAGLEDVISLKRPNTCCWIVCTGYDGLSRDGEWSNWSPYRLAAPLPEEKAELDALCITLQKADPDTQEGNDAFSDYRSHTFSPGNHYSVCGFCRSVCTAKREERLERRKLVETSGHAVLAPDGTHIVAKGETVTVETPFKVGVAIEKETLEKVREGKASFAPSGGQNLMGEEVLKFLARKFNAES